MGICDTYIPSEYWIRITTRYYIPYEHLHIHIHILSLSLTYFIHIKDQKTKNTGYLPEVT